MSKQKLKKNLFLSPKFFGGEKNKQNCGKNIFRGKVILNFKTRERERERERQTDRQTDTREMDGEIDCVRYDREKDI